MVGLLKQLSGWKVILPLFIILCVFTFLIFPQYQARLTEHAGEALAPLDTRFSYSKEDVLRDFEKLGPEGRDVYRVVVAPIDMIYPLVYGSLFILALANILKKLFPDSRMILVSLVPLLGVMLDYAENFNTLRLLRDFPSVNGGHVSLGEQLTRMKHFAGIFSVLLILVFGVVLIVRRIRKPRQA